ncbi:MAG TPA: recombination protein O N-terminal domain-containing protein [Candidatus Paceibacterota bacterium]
MHKLYSHSGIILSVRSSGEKSSFVSLLSRGLGKISAKAVSSRAASGKLKGHIMPYSAGVYTLVRGKEGWKLIQAEVKENFLSSLKDLPKKKIVARVCQLIAKIVGEEGEPKLFDCIYTGLKTLAGLDSYVVKTFEVVLVGRILNILGFLSFADLPESLKDFNNFSDRALLEVKHFEKELVQRINNGLKESNLVKTV